MKAKIKAKELTGSLSPQVAIPSATIPKTTKPKIVSTTKNTTPWSTIRHHTPANTQQKIAIIGAGISGCQSAYTLAKRGFTVTLIDRNAQSAQGASGNPQGVLYAKLSAHKGVLGEFNLATLLYAQQFYHSYWQDTRQAHQACGVLQLAYTKTLERNYAAIGKYAAQNSAIDYLSPADASHVANHTLQHHALYFPRCGWLQPVELCHWLLQHPNITLVTDTEITELQCLYPKNQEQKNAAPWQLKSPSRHQAISQLYDHVIIANAYDALMFKQTHWLPIKQIRGQISYINTTTSLSQLQTVVCGQGYITPPVVIAGTNSHTIGASFNLHSSTSTLSDEDHDRNRLLLFEQLPTLNTDRDRITIKGGRVGFRCTSPDYLPIVGPVPNTQSFKQDFYSLSKNANKSIAITGQYLPQLYTNIAHGSRGLAYTPLCAEIIASIITGEPPPVSQEILEALNPARFLIRALIKNKHYPN